MPTLDEILASVQPVACDDLTLRVYQSDQDIDHARRRLERVVTRGSDDVVIRRALSTLHLMNGA
jgi:hypothetical protein